MESKTTYRIIGTTALMGLGLAASALTAGGASADTGAAPTVASQHSQQVSAAWDYQKPSNSSHQSGKSYTKPGSKPGKSYKHKPGKSYKHPGKGYNKPGKGYSKPGKGYSKPGKSYNHPTKSYKNKPGKSYNHPAKSYKNKPGKSYNHPTKSYKQPAKSYNNRPVNRGPGGHIRIVSGDWSNPSHTSIR
jgi:hypothetical protein